MPDTDLQEQRTGRFLIMTASTKSTWARTGVFALTMMAATYAWTQYAGHEDAQQALLEQAIVSEKLDPYPGHSSCE